MNGEWKNLEFPKRWQNEAKEEWGECIQAKWIECIQDDANKNGLQLQVSKYNLSGRQKQTKIINIWEIRCIPLIYNICVEI